MDLNLVAALAAWAGVVCAFVVVWLQNRATRRLTCLQLFMQLAAQYDSVDMQRARARLAQQLLDQPDRLDINDTVLVFYENLAILHRRKFLDPDLMFNTFSYDVRSYWLALHPYIKTIRTRLNEREFFREFESLNDFFVADVLARGVMPLTRERANEILTWEARRNHD